MSARPTTRPIMSTDRVSAVLARDESLVEVIVRHAPALARLRNPRIRHVMTRLVTIEQAARMAGVSAAALTQALNDALHGALDAAPATDAASVDGSRMDALDIEASFTSAPAASDEPQTHSPRAPVVELDVRTERGFLCEIDGAAAYATVNHVRVRIWRPV